VKVIFREAVYHEELLALRWKNIDFEQQVLTLNEACKGSQEMGLPSGSISENPIIDDILIRHVCHLVQKRCRQYEYNSI
jgi:hypothetical protein